MRQFPDVPFKGVVTLDDFKSMQDYPDNYCFILNNYSDKFLDKEPGHFIGIYIDHD